MSEMGSLVEQCVAIIGAPETTTEKQFLQMIQNHVPTAIIQQLKFLTQGSVKKWILWMDSSESVECLFGDIQKEEINISNENYTVSFYRCDESDIPENWVREEEPEARHPRPDNNASGFQRESTSFDDTFEEGRPENTLQGENVGYIKLSNLPVDIEEDFIELFFEEQYGSEIRITTVEFIDNRTVAVLRFQNQEVTDWIMKNQPFEIEEQVVYAEMCKSQDNEDGEPKTIEVTADKGVITEKSLKTIKMYFSNNTRSGGGKIVDCSIIPESETIQITFESTEVARNVSVRNDHKYKGKLLNVVLLDAALVKKRKEIRDIREKPKTIKITNLPDEIDRFMLELFFEDAETFGEELHVVDVAIESDKAFVEFEKAEAVDIIIKKQPLEFEGQRLCIEVKDEQNQQLSCTVEVKGPVNVLTENALGTLKLYFKSTKRSGGGTIVECYLVEPGVAEVTFETNEVARRVAEKGGHTLKSKHLDVSLKSSVTEKQETHTDHPHKLLILGADAIDRETLVLHLEDMFEGVQVINVHQDVEQSSAVVIELDGPEGIQTILRSQPITIDGQTLSVQLFKEKPSQFYTVEVRGPQNINTCLDVLKLYFKNVGRSGGGTIVKCTADNNVAYLTFETQEVAQRVVNRPEHNLKNQPLAVSLYKPDNQNENVLQKKIVLKHLPKSVDEEFVGLFFEDINSNCEIHVKSVTFNTEDASAIVQLHDTAAVEFILRQKSFEMKGETVTVQSYEEKKQVFSTVEVRGPANIGKEMEKLKLYFKNRKRSGGGSIVSVNEDRERNVAYFTFESHEVAETVVSTDHSKQGLEVTLVREVYPSDKTSDQTISTVKVRGIENKLTEETLLLYFESEKRSGGGPIESVTDDVEDQCVKYINFSRPKDAKNVVTREHQVQGCLLHLSLYVPPPFYDDKVLIKGLKSTKDTLFLYLEAKAQADPVSIDFHEEEEDTVLVTMKTKLDFEKLEKACQEKTLEGTSLKVSKIPVSNCIFVSNLGPDVTKDTIQYYFENKQKSGGGYVEKVAMNETDDTERSCLVYFEDYKVIDNILQREHKLGNTLLIVKVFQQAIGQPEGETRDRTFQAPQTLEVKDADVHKMKFLVNSPDFRDTFEKELLQYYAKVTWQMEKNANLQIQCTLTKDVKGCFKTAKTWEKQIKSVFEKQMKTITVNRIDVLQDIKQKVVDFLKTIKINEPSKVAIVVENEQRLIFIVGEKDIADDLKKQIETAIEKIIEDAEKERQKVKEVFTNLKPIETNMMMLENVSHNLEEQFTDLKVRIVPQKNEIQLEGMISSVQSAKLALYDKKSTYEQTRIDNISRLSASLLATHSIKTELNQKMKSNGITAVWEIDAQVIELCCSKPSFSENAVQIICTYLQEDTVRIERGTVPDLETDMWRCKLEDIYKRNPDKVKIDVSDNATKVNVCATANVMKYVLEEIKTFIQAHTVVTKEILHSAAASRLIDKHFRPELKTFAKQLQNYHVNIKVLNKGFEIRGVQQGVKDASANLQKLLKKISQTKHTVTKPGIAEHIRSIKGRDNIHTIETTLPCIITVERDEAYQQLTSLAHGKRILASCNIFQKRNINVWQGDITELEIDVIVNPSDKKLGFSGGLGKAILSKGGLTIRHECESYTRTHGELKDGDVFISTGGDLKSEHIAHIKSPEWKQGNGMDKELERTVITCLLEASKRQAKSVAIPAIGCGVNRFPVETSTSSIAKAIQSAFREYQDSSVCEIYLCDMNEKNVRGFTQALCSTFGSTNVEIFDYGLHADGRDDFSPEAFGARPKRLSTPRMPGAPDINTTQPERNVYQRQGTATRNLTVTVVKGEIAKQTVDVIVNTTSNNLHLRNGVVSTTLLATAGKELQDELSAKYPDGLKGVDVAVSRGHKLNCKIVIHTALPNFNDKKPKESMKVLQKLIRNCLEEAQKQNYCSIAFPAIGTGTLGYPRETVAAEMFKATSKFQKVNPNSCINDIRFVVYQLDNQTVKAFESEEKRFQGESQTTIVAGQTGAEYCDKSAGGSFRFGSITVTTKQGDITQEDSESIVNSTNEDLNLTIGKVSKTLLQLGGQELREEIENHKIDMKKHKIAVTLAPGLPCKSVIHVVTDQRDLTKTVKKCLTEAENEKFTSIAFPALGAGSIMAAKAFYQDAARDIAKSTIKAVRDFSKTQPKYLLDVRFVIFDREMFQEFQRNFEAAGDSNSWFGSVFQGIKHAIGMSDSNYGKGDETNDAEEKFNSVTFEIMAMDKDVIKKAIKKLDNSLEKEMHTKVIDDPIIQNLEDHQVDEMNGIAIQCHVQMTIDKNRGMIKLSGIVGNVMNAFEKIYSLLRDVERMELIMNIAQWFYIVVEKDGQVVKQYEKNINLAIENAYRQQKDSVAYVEDGIDFIVDFATMEEYPEHDKTDSVKVIRRDLVKGGISELPSHWDDMQGGNLRVVNLKQDSPEYKDIEKKFQDSAKQYKDSNGQLQNWTVTKVSCVVMDERRSLECKLPELCSQREKNNPADLPSVREIERIQNKSLWEQYQSKKKQLEEQNPKGTINERELWHGTCKDPVDSINAHGFNRSYCGKNATVYGDGVYFAQEARYSCQSTYSVPDKDNIKRMYLCLVLTGEYVKGERGMRVPPPKPSGGSNALYDSVTNDVNSLTMFIIFHDTQACPEYMIYFKE